MTTTTKMMTTTVSTITSATMPPRTTRKKDHPREECPAVLFQQSPSIWMAMKRRISTNRIFMTSTMTCVRCVINQASCCIHCFCPKLQEEPPNDWICAYCGAADDMGGKKDGKEQHKAAHACREMERMKTNVVPPLSTYESLRESNIQQNNGRLKALGLQTSPKKTNKMKKNEFNHPWKEGFSQNTMSRSGSPPMNLSPTKSNKSTLTLTLTTH